MLFDGLGSTAVVVTAKSSCGKSSASKLKREEEQFKAEGGEEEEEGMKGVAFLSFIFKDIFVGVVLEEGEEEEIAFFSSLFLSL